MLQADGEHTRTTRSTTPFAPQFIRGHALRVNSGRFSGHETRLARQGKRGAHRSAVSRFGWIHSVGAATLRILIAVIGYHYQKKKYKEILL